VAADRRVYGSRHLRLTAKNRDQLDLEPYARQSSMGYVYLFFYGCRMQTGRESGSAKQVASLVVRTSADSESKPAVVRVIAVVVALATLTIVVVVAPLFCVRTYRPIKASSQRNI